jgi:hypothetical protein
MSRQRSLIFWSVPIRKDREHSWKHHCRSGLTRELLGWVEQMAAKKEAETGVRFVFAKRKTLLTKCFKGKRKEGNNYGSLQHLDRALAELREQHIISKYFDTPDGYTGFVVAPHDSLCHKERNGKTCLLPDRRVQFPDPDLLVSTWRLRVRAAFNQRAAGERSGELQESGLESGGRVVGRVVPAIEESGRESGRESGQSLYLSNFLLLTEEEKADWLTNGTQDGFSTRVTRLSEESDEPMYPSYPRVHDELKHHEEFLKRHAEKQRQRQEQLQQQERGVSASFSEAKPTTAEAKATASAIKSTRKDRKHPVLTPDEYAAAKTERELAELKAEIEARPMCLICKIKHGPLLEGEVCRPLDAAVFMDRKKK